MSCYYHSEATCAHRTRFPNSNNSFHEDAFASNVETTIGNDPWTYVTCTDEECEDHKFEGGCYNAHIDAIVIAVDGACSRNGQVGARPAIGVFFHRDNRSWNAAKVIQDSTGAHTNQRAELRAGLAGPESALRIRRGNPRGRAKLDFPSGPLRKLRRVVIKTDSKYMVDGITDWVYGWDWDGDGYVNRRGTRVSNSGLFHELWEKVAELEGLDVEV